MQLQPLHARGHDRVAKLQYAEENKTQGFIDYGDGFLFSMNAEITLPPESGGPIRRGLLVPLLAEGNPFEELLASARFEVVERGRRQCW